MMMLMLLWLFSEQEVAGIVIDVKKPDGTVAQSIASKSKDAYVGDVRIQFMNITLTENYNSAEIMVYV